MQLVGEKCISPFQPTKKGACADTSVSFFRKKVETQICKAQIGVSLIMCHIETDRNNSIGVFSFYFRNWKQLYENVFLKKCFQILKKKKFRSNESQSIAWNPTVNVVLHVLKVQNKV